jgi:membrane-bound lytic murein transglycosylase D
MRRNAQRGALAALIIAGLLVVIVFIDRWNESQYAIELARIRAASHITNQISPSGMPDNIITEIQVPTDVTLFGERLPLENWEIRERFEREFYYNYNSAWQIVVWWKRSGRYFPMVHAMLESAGLPTDLEYLAVAESGLANVKSPANANGFWQFIPGTAKRFGLRVDDAIDERLDPAKATRAAIAYFKYMKSILPTWTLVAAGYNMGEDNVQQAMQWQHATSYWNLYVNDETMRYVFRIAAIKELMSHADKYGLDFSDLKPYRTPAVHYVTVSGPVASISDWAYQYGVLYKDVKVLNPWLIGRSIPSGTYQIALPLSEEDRATVK